MENRYCDLFILIFVCIALLFVGAVTGATDGNDVSVFSGLQLEWGNTVPPTWSGSDPCGSQWDGVACTGSRVTSLTLPSVGLQGTLPNLIGRLSQLQTLDLSYNQGLTGNLPTTLGQLTSLTILSLIGCSFGGQIPSQLGSLINLNYLALNSNKFIGSIPPSLGALANLTWLDLAANQLTGTLPVSNATQSGLDQLLNANHFHFNLNNLSGTIPPAIFSNKMSLIHILFDSNQFEGGIPSSVGLVNNLKVLRLDRNFLTGTVPSTLSNLASLEEINLSNNQLNGSIPDLSALSNLQYMDMSNNSFTSSQLPQWLTSLQKLTTVVMENCSVNGGVSSNIFSLPALESVRFQTNMLNGTLVIGESSNSLYLVDLRSNNITGDNVNSSASATISLADNPFCSVGANGNLKVCKDIILAVSYETNMANCGNKCSGEMYSNPKTCQCQQPYEGQLTFRAPSFSDLSDIQRFQGLENDLTSKLGVDAVRIFNLQLNEQEYLIMEVQFFPFDSIFFNRSEINRLSMQMSNQLYKPPEQFGPYFFIGTAYLIGATTNSSGLSSGAIAGIAVGVTLLAIGILVVGFYAFRQKKRAEKAIEIHKPFAFWGAGEDNGEAPKLKGARWFSFEEIKKATNNFSELNQIGKGGYGTVYKATFPTGEMAAIKRAQQGSIQGVAEFKNEIELLSRVHHKNLVGLIGFCTEQGEQMLVYEYIPSGTLRENLIGKIPLGWERRLQIALGSARGLSYLHELANPPIIHRDIKSSNILLDENMNGKVADFGLSKLVTDGGIDAGGKGHVSTQVKGTLGYLDPEYYMTQQLSEKSDVYSFGIVLLELITARLPIEGGKYIVRLVNTALDKGGIPCLQQELMDPVLRESTSLIGFEQFLDLAMRCVEELGSERPTMSEAVKELESIVGMGGEEFYSSTKLSQSSRVDVKRSPNLYQGDEDDDSISLSAKGKDDHNNMFEYSGAYMVSRTVQPK